MDSLPSGSNKQLIAIRTAKLDVVIKSKNKGSHYKQLNKDHKSGIVVSGNGIREVVVPDHVYGDETVGYSERYIDTQALFFEQTDYNITVRSHNNEKLGFKSNSSIIDGQVDAVFENEQSMLSGTINYANNIGYSDLLFYVNDRLDLKVRIEVFPSKVDYQDDYKEMMSDIDRMASESLLDFMRRTYNVFVPNHTRNEVPAVFFTVLQGIYDKYLNALNRIAAVPHHKLESTYEVLPSHKVKRTDTRSVKWLLNHPEYAKRESGQVRVERLLSVKKHITYDTQENRFVRFIVKATLKKIAVFSNKYKASVKNPDPDILKWIQKVNQNLNRFLSNSFLSEVSEYNSMQSMSLVFGMAPGYRELYKCYLILQNGISMGGDVFNMSVKDTAQLYEYWCFLKLYEILNDHYRLKSDSIIKVDRTGVTVDLKKGRESTIEFENRNTGEKITLSYNPKETKTQTVTQKPDNILELEKKGAQNSYKYVFDAKYKIEMNPDDSYYPDKNPGPKVEDINTMHRYRDAIVSKIESRFVYEKTMFGAYILFPYSNEEEYRNHQFYKSIDSVNIGGLPFLPSAVSLVSDLLDKLIADSPDTAFEHTSFPVGIESKLKTEDWGRRDVLVGLVDDVASALAVKTYRTGCFDMDKLPIRYIALCDQTDGIHWYGEVVSWRKSDGFDFFDVLSWKELPRTIRVSDAQLKEISYTTQFLLNTAETYSELLVKDAMEYRIYKDLMRDKKIVDVFFEDNQILVNSQRKYFNFGKPNEYSSMDADRKKELLKQLSVNKKA